MKKITILLLYISVVYFGFSQQTTTQASNITTDYLKKSKNQKKTAWIMLGGGATLVLTSFLIPKGEQTGSYTSFDLLSLSSETVTEYENDGIKAAIGAIGYLSMLGSIPFFLASGKNKKRAASISFINERAPQLVKSSFVYRSIPSLNLKISL